MKNILIIKPSSFGDVIQTLPVAARLREAWPSARISWLVNSQYARLLRNNPCIDHLHLFPRELWRAHRNFPVAVASFVRLCTQLYRARFDAVLDLQGLLRSGIWATATGAPLRAGFANARECAHLFYTLKILVPQGEMHSVDRYLLVASALGCSGTGVCFPLGGGEEENAGADRFLRTFSPPRNGPFIALSPSARWRTKRWPLEYYAALGDYFAGKGARIVVIGGGSGEGKKVTGLMRAPALAADGIDDPLKLAALLKRMDLLISNDSGPMHLAAAVGTTVIGLFGPTSPRRTGPYGGKHRIVGAPVTCSPCYRRECERESECMRLITVDVVRRVVEDILSGAR
ncbi:MAG: glycosyltransferase family 9 protein [Candidatus Aureabacteria bacterium]|nr:glycosyltransferase family 9 protein [Candidatus Auribacterota bacterium]